MQVTHEQAKAEGLKRYFTGEACPHGHIAERFVSSRGCCQCAVERQRKRVATDRDGRNAYQREWNAKNKDKWQDYRKSHYEKHKEKSQARSRAYKERSKEHLKQYNQAYRQQNAERFLEYNAMRRASRKERMPGWLSAEDRKLIRSIYSAARCWTRETGVKHVVDHFYPLRGELVSGLHVPANLRVITEEENGKKNNKHPDERDIRVRDMRDISGQTGHSRPGQSGTNGTNAYKSIVLSRLGR